MATTLNLRNTAVVGFGNFYDAITTAGGSNATAVTNTVASGTSIQATRTGGGTVIEWISGRVPAGGFTLAGSVTANIGALESNTNANCGLAIRLYKRSTAGVETQVTGSPWPFGGGTPTELTGSAGTKTWSFTPTSTAFLENERLVIRVFIINVGTMASGYTATLRYNNTSTYLSTVVLTETVAFKAEVKATGSLAATLGAVTASSTGGKVITHGTLAATLGAVTLLAKGQQDLVYATWSPTLKHSDIVISGSGKTIARSTIDSNWRSVLSTFTVRPGEKKFISFLCAGTYHGIGVAAASVDLSSYAGLGTNSIAFYANDGKVFNNGSAVQTWPTWIGAHRVDLCVSWAAAKRAWWRVDNGYWNNIASGNPFTNVAGQDISGLAGATEDLFIIATLFDIADSSSITANFGPSSSQVNAVPTNYSALTQHCTWNYADRYTSDQALSLEDTKVKQTEAHWRSIRATMPVRAGERKFFSVVGYAGMEIGLAKLSSSACIADFSGIDTDSGGIANDNVWYFNSAGTATGVTWTLNLDVCVDRRAGQHRIYFRNEGGLWGGTQTDPTSGGMDISVISTTEDLYPIATLSYVDANTFIQGNFGATPFPFPMPTGYSEIRLTRVGTLAVTLGAVTLAAAGTAPRSLGTLAVTLGAVTDAATAKATAKATAAITLGAVTAAGSGAVVWPVRTGTLAVTLGAVAAAVTAKATAKGTASVTLGAVAAAGTAIHAPAHGTLAVTLGAVGLSSSGTAAFAVAHGTAAVTLAGIALAATGVHPPASGSLAATLGAVALAATGKATAKATAAAALGAVTLASSGKATAKGSLAATLGALTASASGKATAKATLAASLGPVALAAAGTAPRALGSLSATLGAVALAATGRALAKGTAAATLSPVTGLATAVHTPVSGSLARTLGAVTAAATAKAKISGSASATLGAVSLSATAVHPPVSGSFAQTLAAVMGAGAGSAVCKGTLAAELAAFGLAASGRAIARGSLAVTLEPFGLSATAKSPVAGALGATLGPATALGYGGSTTNVAHGSLAVALGAVLGSLAGAVRVRATLAAGLEALALSAQARVPVRGTLASTLAALSAAAAGVAPVRAALGATLGPVAGSSAGRILARGALAATLGDVGLVGRGTVASAIQGALAASLGALDAVAAGRVLVRAALGWELEAVSLAAEGHIRATGRVAETLGPVVLAGAGHALARAQAALALAPVVLEGRGRVAVVAGLAAELGPVRLFVYGLHGHFGAVDVELEPVRLAAVGFLPFVELQTLNGRARRETAEGAVAAGRRLEGGARREAAGGRRSRIRGRARRESLGA